MRRIVGTFPPGLIPGVGAVDPSMGTLGEYVSYQPMAGFGAEPSLPPPVLAPVEARMPGRLERIVTSPLYRMASMLSTGALAFHGYRRNQSVGWAIGWALLGGIAPVIAWPVALAQGFGKSARGLTPNRARSKRRRRKQRKNTSVDETDREDELYGERRFAYFADENDIEGTEQWDWEHIGFREAEGAIPASYRDKLRALPAGRWLALPNNATIKRIK